MERFLKLRTRTFAQHETIKFITESIITPAKAIDNLSIHSFSERLKLALCPPQFTADLLEVFKRKPFDTLYVVFKAILFLVYR